MKKYYLISITVVAVAVAVFLIFYCYLRQPSKTAENLLTYSNTEYGFSFSYPSTYTITERTDPPVHSIILSRKDDPPLPPASDGYPSINVQIIPVNKSIDLTSWLTENPNYSNYMPPNLATSTTTVGNTMVPAKLYYWSGLYNGESLAFFLHDNAVIFSGMYNDPNDQIKHDFDALLASIKITVLH